MKREELRMICTPDYKKILPDLQEEIFVILKQFCKTELIKMCCELSASLYYKSNSELIATLFYRCRNSKIVRSVHREYHDSYTNAINKASMADVYLLILSRCANEGSSHSEDENFIMILKLFLYVNAGTTENLIKYTETTSNMGADTDFSFQRLYWPFLFTQVDANAHSNFISEFCKSSILFNYVEHHHKEAFDRFLKENGFSSSSQIRFLFLDIFFKFYDSVSKGQHPFSIRINDGAKQFFDRLAINDIKELNMMALKSHPVYYESGIYYVLDWNYLSAQLNIGSYMNFRKFLEEICHTSDNKKKKHIDLKGELGKEMESTYFKPILEICFSKYSHTMRFDSDYEFVGYPDCIMKSGRNIFVFEFKDNLFAEHVQASFDYDSYYRSLETNYVVKTDAKGKEEGKAVMQVITYIDNLIAGKYSKKQCEDISIAYDNSINIFPIVVYTDYKYCVQGVNYYLNTRFTDLIRERGYDERILKRIKPLTFICIDYFLNNLTRFKNKQLKFHKLLNHYSAIIKGQEEEHSRLVENGAKTRLTFFQSMYMPFDRICDKDRTIIPPKENAPLIHEIISNNCSLST